MFECMLLVFTFSLADIFCIYFSKLLKSCNKILPLVLNTLYVYWIDFMQILKSFSTQMYFLCALDIIFAHAQCTYEILIRLKKIFLSMRNTAVSHTQNAQKKG